MSPSIEWVDMDPNDPILQPTDPPCGDLLNHVWKLTVHEGRVSLDSGCEDCNDTVMSPVGGEDVAMDVAIVGTLTSHLEKYGWETPGYDHWWEFHPNAIAAPEGSGDG